MPKLPSQPAAPGVPSPRTALRAFTVPRERVDGATRDAMWALFDAAYTGTSRETFESDLAGKEHVILLRDASGALQGFSTLMTMRGAVLGRPYVAIFSGDTVVARAHWGQSTLHRAFLRYALGVGLRHPLTPVYWFLISKGFRTYLLLARNFREYWPRHDAPTPAWHAAVIDQLCRDRFGAAWRPDDGVLRFPQGAGRLRDFVAPVTEDLLATPDIRFFVERNPGHASGDELCCLGRVELGVATHYVAKRARRAWRELSRRGFAAPPPSAERAPPG